MIYIKIHDAEKGSVVSGSVIAMCDSPLVDKVLEEGSVYMDLKTYSTFYKGELVTKENAKTRIGHVENVYSANVVGAESVEVALEMHLIEKGNVKTVQKVPYAQAYNVAIR